MLCRACAALVGNHDKAAIGDVDLAEFNLDARFAVEWTQKALYSENLDYLENLPKREIYVPFTLVHGSPRAPVWEYILDRNIATQNFHYFETDICLVGHTHIPVIYRESDGVSNESYPDYQTPSRFEIRALYYQSRQRGSTTRWRPECRVTRSSIWRRLPGSIAVYPTTFPKTQRRMEAHDLPARLSLRLSKGW